MNIDESAPTVGSPALRSLSLARRRPSSLRPRSRLTQPIPGAGLHHSEVTGLGCEQVRTDGSRWRRAIDG